MPAEIYVTEAAKESLDVAAARLQAHFLDRDGTHYSIADLHACLVRWLEMSLESLAEEAFDHCTGRSAFAFNHADFDRTLKRMENQRAVERLSVCDRHQPNRFAVAPAACPHIANERRSA